MKLLYLLVIILYSSMSCFGQESCFWVEIEGTPGTEADPIFYFSDGAILSYTYVSDQVAISDDKGLSWRFAEPDSPLSNSHFTSYREGVNGDLYFITNSYKHIYQLHRNTLNFELVHTSNDHIFNYGVGSEFLYAILDGELRKVDLHSGMVVDTFSSRLGPFKEVYVSKEEEILVLTASGGSITLSEEFQVMSEIEDMGVNGITGIEVNINNHMIKSFSDSFQYSINNGLDWNSLSFSELSYPWFLLGNNDCFVITDSVVYVYELETAMWTDTIYIDTYLNLEAARDFIYAYPAERNYPFVLHYLDPSMGLVAINHQIGRPDIHDLVALNDSTFFIRDDYIFYQGGRFEYGKGFQKIHQLGTGELVGSTYDNLYISHEGNNEFSVLSPPVTVIDGVTKDDRDRLFIFKYDGIWISTDKGITWTHECPPAYFPAFDILERTIKPKASNIYYAFTDLNNVLSYNHNIDEVNFAAQNSRPLTYSIGQFEVNSEGHVYYTHRVKATNEITLRKRLGNQNIILETPENLSSRFAMNRAGELFIHDGHSIYKSIDAGISWINITNNLPSTVTINMISIADDYTIYLACKNGNVYRCGLDNVISSVEENVIINPYKIYPNPAQNILNVELYRLQKSVAKIYNIQGALQQEINLLTGKNEVNISNLSKGMHYIKVQANKATIKFIKL